MDTVHECDRRTDGQTVGRTDRITITKTVQTASHGKKYRQSASNFTVCYKSCYFSSLDLELHSKQVKIFFQLCSKRKSIVALAKICSLVLNMPSPGIMNLTKQPKILWSCNAVTLNADVSS